MILIKTNLVDAMWTLWLNPVFTVIPITIYNYNDVITDKRKLKWCNKMKLIVVSFNQDAVINWTEMKLKIKDMITVYLIWNVNGCVFTYSCLMVLYLQNQFFFLEFLSTLKK